MSFIGALFQRFSALQRAEIAEIDWIERCVLYRTGFSALQRAEIAEIGRWFVQQINHFPVSVLFNEPKLLKFNPDNATTRRSYVSVLFNEPKLLKCRAAVGEIARIGGFSALQRAEIAEMHPRRIGEEVTLRFSALQRAEIAEIPPVALEVVEIRRFSALQRAEIAEIGCTRPVSGWICAVSVLFNEPKLLKFAAAVGRQIRLVGFSALQRAEIAEIHAAACCWRVSNGFSALQRAEIAEIQRALAPTRGDLAFQCSSTSRNC